MERIDIGLVNKYYDLTANHYSRLSVDAFGVKQEARMEEIDRYFSR